MDFNRKKSNLLYLDCSSGISGDMTVGALLDLGADRKILTDALQSLPLQGYRIEIQTVIKSGLQACDFCVILDELHENHDHDMNYLHGSSGYLASESIDSIHRAKHAPASREQEASLPYEGQMPAFHAAGPEPSHHPEGHDHHGRNLQDITEILKAGKLTPNALNLALKIFRILAEAESQVHGKPLEEVHFHEVGAVDSIVDIAAAAVCIDNLGIEQVIIPFLTEGCGQIRCQHGLLPIPVPATTAIAAAHQLPMHISSIQGELVTPTGAAIAAALRTHQNLPEKFRILRTGLGAGKRNYQTAGILRAMLIEDARTDMDHIFMIETNMDDCTGEAMGFVMEELLSAGALDVFYTPIYMKKHRPAYQLSVMCTPEKRQIMEALIFRHTTTIGLRTYEVQRTKLPRKIISLETPWGMADVKCCQFKEEIYFYPESDSILKLAHANQISFTEMYHEVKEYAAKNYAIL
ncbi:MAG: nickel pincer cofactor biosynthesis protein LarC [Lachnospiraceae bacterium]|nr:nickel pincer cofactor biosynthesis protein LarC [Lachnospiraceae bacterium]